MEKTKSVAVLVEKLVSYLEKTEGLVTEHAPDVIAQYLVYRQLSSFTLLVALAAIIAVFIWFSVRITKLIAKNKKTAGYYDPDGDYFIRGICWATAALTSLFFVVQTNCLIKVLIAPKVVILEYLKTLI